MTPRGNLRIPLGLDASATGTGSRGGTDAW